MEYGGTDNIDLNQEGIHYVIIDPPYNAETDTYEENWIVTKKGIFYSAKCID